MQICDQILGMTTLVTRKASIFTKCYTSVPLTSSSETGSMKTISLGSPAHRTERLVQCPPTTIKWRDDELIVMKIIDHLLQPPLVHSPLGERGDQDLNFKGCRAFKVANRMLPFGGPEASRSRRGYRCRFNTAYLEM